ncbi:MAG: glycosyltransferase family 4 protein [Gammaproteobacteria bacterium]|nr:glycosyltransferase family 4 protein [Gammaproteobacteria bacterium]
MQKKNIYINGRFLCQRITGVQRYAHEMIQALDTLSVNLESPYSFVIVVPKNAADLQLQHIQVKKIGWGISGYFWEQVILPFYVGKNLLLNFCNLAPMFKHYQLVTIHDASILDHPEWFKTIFVLWYKLVFAQLAKHVCSIITVSDFSRQRLCAHLPNLAKKTRVIAAAIGTQFVPQASAIIANVKRQYKIADNYFIYVGSLEPRKNLPKVIEAWSLVCNKLTNYQLLIVGAKGAVFSANTYSYNAPNVLFLDAVTDSELIALLSGAIALVYPSLYEGFGLPPLEAMACGTPVIVSNVASLPEVIGEDNAFFVNPNSSLEIANGFQFFAVEKAKRQLFKEKGLLRVQIFNWLNSAKNLLQQINKMV